MEPDLTAHALPEDPLEARSRRGRPKGDALQVEARLVDEAARLFFEKGYGHTTMSALATAARVSKTTLYSCFPGKADLFRAMVARQMNLWGNGEQNIAIPSEAPLEGLLLAYGDLALRAGTSEEFIQVNRLLYSEAGRFPELAAIANDRMGVGVKYLSEEIRMRTERDGVPVHDPVRMAQFYLTLLAGWLSNATLQNEVPTFEERQAWLRDAVHMFVQSVEVW